MASRSILFILYGERLGNAFSIKVDDSLRVVSLKKLVKAETAPRLDDIAAHELQLYSVDIEIDDDDDSEIRPDLTGKRPLGLRIPVIQQLPSDLKEDHVYVIVKRPPPAGK